MLRVLILAATTAALTGCAGTFDTIGSRKFRKAPLDTTWKMISPEDPMVVLRANPQRDGDERAHAMHRLKEPILNGRSQTEQDEIVDMLGRTATSDSSPVLRIAAIEALGRFTDPRAPGILIVAYQKAHGRAEGIPDPTTAEGALQLIGGPRAPGGRVTSSMPLTGPVGFGPDVVETIRCCSAESLGRTNSPDAVPFLSAVAAGPTGPNAPEGCDDREVRLAAVRGLGTCRRPESVAALSKVLATEAGKDTAVSGRAHSGLVNLTGKHLPADPQQWNQVVQAGAEIAPEPSWVENAFEWIRK